MQKIILILSFLVFIVLVSITPSTHVYVSAEVIHEEVDTEMEIIEKLAMCESSLNEFAYNPEDNDGLPKYGYLQYRYETFMEQAIKYEILPRDADFKTLIWDKQLQIEVAKRMIRDDKGYRWGCWKKVQ